jgi:ferric-dicitrate binding protein FerR (iron transport regulator)
VDADAVRAYRVDRVSEVAVLGGGFEAPAGLDPVAALEEHLAAGWRHRAVVVVDAPLDEVARYVPRTLGQLEAVGPGATRLSGTTSNPQWYAEQLARIPAAFRVEGDEAVRAAARATGERLMAAVPGRDAAVDAGPG